MDADGAVELGLGEPGLQRRREALNHLTRIGADHVHAQHAV